MTTVADWHTRALAATGRIVASIPADRWRARTPCPEWEVRGLVSHLVSGNWWAAELGAGGTIETGGRPARRRRARRRPGCGLRRVGQGRLGCVPPARGAGRAVRGVVRAGPRVGIRRSPVHRRPDPRLGPGHGHRAGRGAR